jgi:hypothetical protein
MWALTGHDRRRTKVTAVNDSVDPADRLAAQLQAQDLDLLRSMVKAMAEALMSAEADARCGAGYGQRSSERTNSRNGYRTREWDTRAGTVELAIPKLRQGSYFPDWLLDEQVEAFLQPSVGRRPLHLRVAGRAYAEGPRRRADRQRARPGRHRRQRHGWREILGLEVTTSEDGAGWLALAEQNDEWAE